MQAKLKNYVLHSLPRRVRVLPHKGASSYITDIEKSHDFERVKLHFHDRHFLMTDYDKPSCTAHEIYDLEPNFVIYNVQTCTHQAFWLLTTPVHCQDKNSPAYRYLRAVESAYDHQYDCDHAFAREVSRNPLFHGSDVDWRHDKPYELRELASVTNLNAHLGKKQRRLIESHLGRNDEVFNNLRLSGYDIVKNASQVDFERLFSQLIIIADRFNQYDPKLPDSEIRSICRSIARFCVGRFNQSMTNAQFSELQARRGAVGGKKSKRTKVKTSARTTKPWDDLGISRATYYRQIKNSKTTV